jgi:hypothetical protein
MLGKRLCELFEIDVPVLQGRNLPRFPGAYLEITGVRAPNGHPAQRACVQFGPRN